MPKPMIDALKFLTLPALLVLLGGCGGSSSSTPAKTPLSVSAKTPSGMTLTLSEDASVIPANGSVTYTLTLTNTTFQPVNFSLWSGCAENVRSSSGAPFFSGAVDIFSQAGVFENFPPCDAEGYGPPTQVLKPGQSLSGTISVNSINAHGYAGYFSTPGRYTASGLITEEDANSQTIHTFTGALPITVR